MLISDINAVDRYGDTPFSLAVEAGRKDVLDFLIKNGAKCKINESFKSGVRQRTYSHDTAPLGIRERLVSFSKGKFRKKSGKKKAVEEKQVTSEQKTVDSCK